MSAFSNDAENKIINHFLRGSTASTPSVSYVALFTADPTDANVTANEVTVAAWPAYVRKDAADGGAISTGWTAPADGVSTNAKAITFPANNGAGNVVVTHVGLYDSGTIMGGNLILANALASPKTLAPGDVLSFAIGALTVTVQ